MKQIWLLVMDVPGVPALGCLVENLEAAGSRAHFPFVTMATGNDGRHLERDWSNPMKYLMLVCTDPDYKPSPEDLENAPDVEAWVEEMDGRGVRLMGNRTRPATDATTVRVRNGEVLLTDGPFAETKEQMAGFDIIDCADLDEAIEVSSKHPMAWGGMIELRPFWDDDAD